MSGFFLTLHFKIQGVSGRCKSFLWEHRLTRLGIFQRKHKSETHAVFIHCTFCLNVKSPYVEEVSTVLLEKFLDMAILAYSKYLVRESQVTFPLRDEL